MDIKSADFSGSFHSEKILPKEDLPEFAFAGRSNVGKSSLINMLVNRNGLAKTSSTPGKTQCINLFTINKEWNLVDLPGYGFAKVSKNRRFEFSRLISGYIKDRQSLVCVMVLIDCRLPPQVKDLSFIEWLGANGVPLCLVFTKIDKLKPQEFDKNIENYKNELLKSWESLPPMYFTSAFSKTGRENFLAFIKQTLKAFKNAK